MTHEELEHLSVAWMRRKKLEARLVAIEVMRMLTGQQEEQQASSEESWAEFVSAVEG